MTLSIDGMMRNATQGQKATVAATVRADQAAGAHDLASTGIGQQANATSVQLSVYGLVKSSFAEVQSAGNTLSMPGKTSTIEDTTKAVQSFASAYNNVARTVSSAVQGGGTQVNLAAVDLGRVVTSGNNAADLKRAGVKVAQDGTLSVDTQTLQGALQANPDVVLQTLTKIGSQAAQVSGGILAGSVNSAAGASVRELPPGATQRFTSATKGSAQQQAAVSADYTTGGVAAYRQMSRQ